MPYKLVTNIFKIGHPLFAAGLFDLDAILIKCKVVIGEGMQEDYSCYFAVILCIEATYIYGLPSENEELVMTARDACSLCMCVCVCVCVLCRLYFTSLYVCVCCADHVAWEEFHVHYLLAKGYTAEEANKHVVYYETVMLDHDGKAPSHQHVQTTTLFEGITIFFFWEGLSCNPLICDISGKDQTIVIPRLLICSRGC